MQHGACIDVVIPRALSGLTTARSMDAHLMSIRREAVEHKSGYDRVVAFLREELLSGALKTGDCLLPERELAAQLGVGRPVLREALRALAMIGALEIRHGVGTIVKKPDVSTLGEFFTFVPVSYTHLTLPTKRIV